MVAAALIVDDASIRSRESKVALNRTDVCIGPLWPTTQRRGLGATFTIPLQNENVMIAIPKNDAGNLEWKLSALLSEVKTIFDPFGIDVWIAFLVTGESPHPRTTTTPESLVRPLGVDDIGLLLVITILSQGEKIVVDTDEGYTRGCTARLVDASYATLVTLPESAGRLRTKSWISMIFVGGLAWAFLVFQTLYTAQVRWWRGSHETPLDPRSHSWLC